MANPSARRQRDTQSSHGVAVQSQSARESHDRRWRRDSSEATIQSTGNDIWLAVPLSLPASPVAAYASVITTRATSTTTDRPLPIPTSTPTGTDPSEAILDGTGPPSRSPSRSSSKSPTIDKQPPYTPSSPTTDPIIWPLKPIYPPPARKPTPPGLPSYDIAQEAARETRARGRARRSISQWPPPAPPLLRDGGDFAAGNLPPYYPSDMPLPEVWHPPRSAHDVRMRHHPYIRGTAAESALPAISTTAVVTARSMVVGGGGDRGASFRGGRNGSQSHNLVSSVIMGEPAAVEGSGEGSWVAKSGCCCLWHLGSGDSSVGDSG